MVPIHPGRILRRELAAREMSANRLALALRVPSGRITSILNGRRAISADTALRLARHLGTSAQFWMNLQTRYDLTVAERDHGARIAAEVEPCRVTLVAHPKKCLNASPDPGGLDPGTSRLLCRPEGLTIKHARYNCYSSTDPRERHCGRHCTVGRGRWRLRIYKKSKDSSET